MGETKVEVLQTRSPDVSVWKCQGEVHPLMGC